MAVMSLIRHLFQIKIVVNLQVIIYDDLPIIFTKLCYLWMPLPIVVNGSLCHAFTSQKFTTLIVRQKSLREHT